MILSASTAFFRTGAVRFRRFALSAVKPGINSCDADAARNRPRSALSAFMPALGSALAPALKIAVWLPLLLSTFLPVVQPAFGQVTTDPAFPTLGGPVTITFDATQGTGGLAGHTGDVYVHTGVITSASTTSSDWKYVVTEWGENTPATRLTRIGDDLYTLTIDDILAYYNVPDGETVQRLAMVFRSGLPDATGAYLEGKALVSGNPADIFVDLYEAQGISIRFTQPGETSLLVEQGASIPVVVEASAGGGLASIELFRDGISVATSATSPLQTTLTADASGNVILRAVATDAGGATEQVELRYTVPSPTVDAPRPAGIDLGIHYPRDQTKATLSLLAPYKRHVFVIGEFNDWQFDAAYQMKRHQVSADEVYWWLELDGLEPGREYAFQYVVDGEIRIADPFSEKVLHPDDAWIPASTYPGLKPYPTGKTTEYVGVLQTAKPSFNWTDSGFQRPAVEDLVIYELLVRDFDESHSFQAVIDRLDYLQGLGINAIELLPVNEFEGNSSWGYNPAFYFAVDRYYGPAEDLKRLVNEAHRRGMAVILDKVYNHSFGQSPMVRLYNEGNYGAPTAQNPWFNTTARHPFNVGYDINHENRFVQAFFDRVNRYWVEEFHIDGFRYDLSKGFTQRYSGSDVGYWNQYDDSRVGLLNRMKGALHSAHPGVYMILEHLGNNDEETALANSGFMLWGKLHSEFKEAALGYPDSYSDFSWGSWQSRGWSHPHLVGYMESHDEERLTYDMLNYGNAFNTGHNPRELPVALSRMKTLHAFLFGIPGPKMMWQFGEVGYDVNIDFNGRTGEKPIRWEYASDPDRDRLYRTVGEMARLKTEVPAFGTRDFTLDTGGKVKRILLRDEVDVQLLGNFDIVAQTAVPFGHNSGSGKWWYEYFSGDSLWVSEFAPPSFTMQPAELRVYSTAKLGTPPPGLLDETASPGMSLSTDTLRFTAYSDQGDPPPYTGTLQVRNTGSAVLQVTGVQGDGDAAAGGVFSATPATMSVPVGGSGTLSVRFEPAQEGEYAGTFTVSGTGVDPVSFAVAGSYTSAAAAPPELLAPEDGAAGLDGPVELRWTAAAGAARYGVQVAEDAAFGALLVDTDTVSATALQVGEGQEVVAGGTYHWRVRSVNEFGASDWSAVRSFSLRAPVPDAPVLESPADGAAGVPLSPVLSWQASAGADRYRVEVSGDADFNVKLVDTDTAAATSLRIPAGAGLRYAETYHWRVAGVNASGEGAPSDARSFTTAAPAPELLAPADGAAGVSLKPVLEWTAVEQAAGYQVEIALADGGGVVAFEQGLAEPRVVASALQFETEYRWRARAVFASGLAGAWSARAGFTTRARPTDVPIPVSPADGATGVDVSVNLRWEAVTGVAGFAGYQVQVASVSGSSVNGSGNGSSGSVFDGELLVDRRDVTATSFALDGLAYGTSYAWRVRIVLEDGGETSWSDVFGFETAPPVPDAPVLTSPVEGAVSVGRAPVLEWERAAGSLRYELVVATGGAVRDTVLRVDTLTAPRLVWGDREPLAPATRHVWSVRGVNGTGTGAWAEAIDFTTVELPPDGVGLVAPAEGADELPTTVVLEWGASERAVRYDVQLALAADFSAIAEQAEGVGETRYRVEGLLVDTLYHWRVRAVNDGGASDWSRAWSFRTGRIGTPELRSPADGSFAHDPDTLRLRWSNASAARSYTLQISESAAFAERAEFTALTDTAVAVPFLERGTRYHWRVNATDVNGLSSPWSASQSFHTLYDSPSAPQPAQPADGATGVEESVTLGWIDPDGAPSGTTYRVQLARTREFQDPMVDTLGLLVPRLALADVEGLGALDPAGTYYWRVAARNPQEQGPWSAPFGFTMASSVTRAAIADPGLGAAGLLRLDAGASVQLAVDVTVPGVSEASGAPQGVSVWVGWINPAVDAPGGAPGSSPAEWPETAWRPAGYLQDRTDSEGAPADRYVRTFTTGSPGSADLGPGYHEAAFRIRYADGPAFYAGVGGPWQAGASPSVPVLVREIPERVAPEDARLDVQPNDLSLQWSLAAQAPSAGGDYSIQSGYPRTLWVQLAELGPLNGAGGDGAGGIRPPTSEDFVIPAYQNTSLEPGAPGHTPPLGTLKAGTAYAWRIRAHYGEDGGAGAWSESGTFATLAPQPGTVTLLQPAPGASGTSLRPDFVWSDDPVAVRYELELALASDVTVVLPPEEVFRNPLYRVDTLTAPAWQLPLGESLDHQTSYMWRVRGVSSGGAGQWSDASGFTTSAAPPAAPDLLAPEPDAAGVSLTPEFEWNPVEGATGYRLELSLNPGFDPVALLADTLTDPEFTVPAARALQTGTAYHWRVRARNQAGDGEWSASSGFQTLEIGVPELLAPADGELNLDPAGVVLRWSGAAGAATYSVQISEDSSFAVRAQTDGLAATELQPDVLERNARYHWRVRAVDVFGKVGAWSGSSSFTTRYDTPALLAQVTPVRGAEGLADPIRFEWSDPDAARWSNTYRLQIALSPSFSEPAVDTAGLTHPRIDLDGFAFGQTYYWRVRSTNPSATAGPWSETWNYSTLPTLPDAPVLLTPDDGARNVSTSPAFTWQDVDGASHYDLQLAGSPDFAQRAELSGLTEPRAEVDGLPHEQTLFWRVRAVNAAGNGPWSGAFQFLTQPTAPGQPGPVLPLWGETVDPAANRFVWTAAPGAGTYRLQISRDINFEQVDVDSAGLQAQLLRNLPLEAQSEFYWRVQAVNGAGPGPWSSAQRFFTGMGTSVRVDQEIPLAYELSQNYPNPFNPSTLIRFSLPEPADVRLDVFDLEGRLVAELASGTHAAGVYEVRFDAADLSSGTYLYRLQAGPFTRVRMLTLIK